ncbi:archaellin/type IV pilin N-terminal domain-containing protein [Salarchaeum japonicum]|uniref:Flagellin n=1 Tax=Salarchaeum japonicum TaxID=555573 RepID=A0AAV3T066_9EURY|nr:archaellin/type IV pilin N-terminal domain-containing protein [Salarchaeum japonicum]
MVDISIPRPDFEKDRGQIGIETLVVFIAMILVAALAAGVLINTAGLLQTSAQSTSQDAQSGVTDRLDVSAATGIVNNSTDGKVINQTTISVSLAPGSDSINVSKTTIRWTGPSGATTLTNEDFSVNAVTDEGGTVPVLNSQNDRFQVVINISDGTNPVAELEDLEGGDEVHLTFVTSSGAETVFQLNVPASLADAEDGEAVRL